MSKATEDLLDSLHGSIAKELLERIKTGEATPADINAAIRFLKDNDVKADIEYNKPLQHLNEMVIIEDLPFEVSEE